LQTLCATTSRIFDLTLNDFDNGVPVMLKFVVVAKIACANLCCTALSLEVT
jgi:hypothetical protein